MLILGVGAEQGAIADDVDDARHAAAQPVHFAQRGAREDLAAGAGHAQPVAHVGKRVLARQRLQVEARGDALRQLAQVVAPQQLAQLRLADQDDLQQLLRLGLEIGEQAHLFQHFGAEVLRLIDDQHHAAPGGVGAQQVVVQQVDELLGVLLGAVRHADAELLADGLQEIQRREPRIDDQGDFRVLGRTRQQRADRGGLAGADLAGQLDEAAGFIDAVDQVRQRVGVVAAQVQVARVRRDRKGFFGDAEEGEGTCAACRPGRCANGFYGSWGRGRHGRFAHAEFPGSKLVDIDDVHDQAVVIAQRRRLPLPR